jgi:hypothetical protein
MMPRKYAAAVNAARSVKKNRSAMNKAICDYVEKRTPTQKKRNKK